METDDFPNESSQLSSWSKSARSPCFVYHARDAAGIAAGMASARARHLTLIPHGAGHSYTDAALNTGGIVLDVTRMRKILSWDPVQGIMQVEAGVTLREMARVALKDGWWPFVSPSSAEVTIGGSAAMNVTDRNAWKCGPFGQYVISFDVLLLTGELCTIVQEQQPELFRAFVGSLGLLGIITSIKLQLQRIEHGFVSVRKRPTASLEEVLAAFAEEAGRSDFMEAWLDGFASGRRLGRGLLTCARLVNSDELVPAQPTGPGRRGLPDSALLVPAANLFRPILEPAVRAANRFQLWRGTLNRGRMQVGGLYEHTYWPSAAIAAYHVLFPQGVETFQAFVPSAQAREVFSMLLRYSQQQQCLPVWCIMKRHQRDPFLLSYQVDGFSLELNYQRTPRQVGQLERTLRQMISAVIEAGGRFYLAKDHFMTSGQYRQSIGDQAVQTFLDLKRRYDPESLLQSDLFRRIFLPAIA